MRHGPQFWHLLAALIALSLIFSAIERFFAANPGQPCWRSDIKTDIAYWFITSMLTKPLTQLLLGVSLMIVLHTTPAQLRELAQHRDTLVTHQPVWLQALEVIFLGDFIGYWTHRWFHGRRLWKFHAVHHCSRELDWLSAIRLHPVNEWLSRLIAVMVLFVLGFSAAGLAVYVPFLTFYAIMIHANVNWSFGRLSKYIASPVFHRWHHTSQEEGLDKNFAGLFSFIDRMFGTYYMPEGKVPQRFGLHEETIPQTIIGQMLYPFR